MCSISLVDDNPIFLHNYSTHILILGPGIMHVLFEGGYYFKAATINVTCACIKMGEYLFVFPHALVKMDAQRVEEDITTTKACGPLL